MADKNGKPNGTKNEKKEDVKKERKTYKRWADANKDRKQGQNIYKTRDGYRISKS